MLERMQSVPGGVASVQALVCSTSGRGSSCLPEGLCGGLGRDEGLGIRRIGWSREREGEESLAATGSTTAAATGGMVGGESKG